MPDVDRIALVTGASRGIGLAIAERLVRAGYRVALTARDGTRLAAHCRTMDAPARVMAVAADLTDQDAPARILAAVQAEFGMPTILVNNAGTAPSDRIEKTTDAVLDQVLTLHIAAPFRLIRAALPAMRETSGSCIVQMASTAGLTGFPFTAAYCAGKHGMVGLSRALAAEVGAHPPRVYAVCPGFVDTEITRDAAAAIARRGKQTESQALQALGAMNRIGRMHTPEEVAAAVVDLVTTQPDGCVYNLDQDPPGFV